MRNCGTDPETIRNNMRALIRIGWLKRVQRHRFELTDDYITEDIAEF
jgi:hypothetical protein